MSNQKRRSLWRRIVRASSLTVSVLVMAVVGLLIVVAFRSVRPSMAPSLASTLTVSSEPILAGEAFELWIDDVTVGTEVTVDIDLGYGVHRARTLVQANGRVEVPAIHTAGSGEAIVTVSYGSRWGTTTVAVEPGPPAGTVELLVGPRTVRTGSFDYAEGLALAVDDLDNPVAEGTEVAFTVRRPDGTKRRVVAASDGLFADIVVSAGPMAGRSLLSATAGAVSSVERSWLEVPDHPAPFDLRITSQGALVADGQSLVSLATSDLVDEFGNQFPAGVGFMLDAWGPTGHSRHWGQVIDGKGLFVLEAPTEPGTVLVQAEVSGVLSEPTELRFAPAISDLPTTVTWDDELMTIIIGPVQLSRGGLVPDGTMATVSDGEQEFEVALLEGRGEVALIPRTSDVTVSSLGVTVQHAAGPASEAVTE